MGLIYTGATNMPSGLSLDNASLFTTGQVPPTFTLTGTSQDGYWPVQLYNNSGHSFIVNGFAVIPARQHRQYGGRVDGTRLGWVMYEADRVMKCLGVGKDNLTGATYSSATVSVPGYQNMLERDVNTGDTGGFSRMWFVPNDMTLRRYVDPTTGQATITFQNATVALLTESYLQGLPADAAAQAFVTHFQNNYDSFAALNFPVQNPDPNAPPDQQIINVPIFAMLKEAMQAVSLARFFRDNNIPLDMSWMSSWQPPATTTPKSVATATNTSTSNGHTYLIYGGVQITKPNNYTPSTVAASDGQAIISARPNDPSKPAEDIKQQAWSANTSLGTMNAVSASMSTDHQDGNVKLVATDLSFASPGELPLSFKRYYQSSWTGSGNMGPGWRNTRYFGSALI